MILKFEDFIKEGLWSKGVDRSKTGEERLENKNDTYENIKKICLVISNIIADYHHEEFDENSCRILRHEDNEFQIQIRDNQIVDERFWLYPDNEHLDINDVLHLFRIELDKLTRELYGDVMMLIRYIKRKLSR